MKSFFILIMLLLFISKTSVSQEDRRTDKSKLTVTTFNTYFMWDGIEPERGQVDLPYKGDSIAAGERMEDIAFVIKSINPDIINLVEVENLSALKRLNNKYLQGMGYKAYLVDGLDFFTGQDVGLLTRIDPENNEIARWPEKGMSNGVEKSVAKNYYAKFDINGKKIAIIEAYLLSSPSSIERLDQRQAQADAIRKLAEKLDSSGYSVIVLGDFNDFDGSPDCLDLKDDMPITTVLRDIKELSNSTNTDDLVNVQQFIEKHNRYTDYWDKNFNNIVDGISELSSLDHILIAPELVFLKDTVFIYHDFNPNIVSDHFPVTVKFKIGTNSINLPKVKIVSLLPNPLGDERQKEKVVLHNFSENSVTITGWHLKDIAQNTWEINATIPANSGIAIFRNGQKMSLNNSGDEIELINDKGEVIDKVFYATADEEEIIFINN